MMTLPMCPFDSPGLFMKFCREAVETGLGQGARRRAPKAYFNVVAWAFCPCQIHEMKNMGGTQVPRHSGNGMSTKPTERNEDS